MSKVGVRYTMTPDKVLAVIDNMALHGMGFGVVIACVRDLRAHTGRPPQECRLSTSRAYDLIGIAPADHVTRCMFTAHDSLAQRIQKLIGVPVKIDDAVADIVFEARRGKR